MMVEESRILQVTIFQTLQKNLGTIDFSVLLLGVMTIADEVDSQLSQAMKSYIAESIEDAWPPEWISKLYVSDPPFPRGVLGISLGPSI